MLQVDLVSQVHTSKDAKVTDPGSDKIVSRPSDSLWLKGKRKYYQSLMMEPKSPHIVEKLRDSSFTGLFSSIVS